MHFYLLELSPIEITVLCIIILFLILAVIFYYVDRKLVKKAELHFGADARKILRGEDPQSQFDDIPSLFPKKKKKKEEAPAAPARPAFAGLHEKPREELLMELKQTLIRQQTLSETLMARMEQIEDGGKEELKKENEELLLDIHRLEGIIDKKNAEINTLKQQATVSQSMATRIEEVYKEFEQLQAKMLAVEKQAGKANLLAIELQDAQQSYEQVHKELERKQHKLEESFAETQNLQQQLHEMEDKFAEANLQRQQLQKKVQFLTDMNNELQSMADANKKLQTELRRIGELESMLDIIAQERDQLLKKQSK